VQQSVKSLFPQNKETEVNNVAQIDFTLDYDFLVGLFSESPQTAFGKLMEQILNQFIGAESEDKLKAKPHERNEERTDYRNGVRTRNLTHRIGKLELAVPRHRYEPFHSCILESYQRNESALIASMMEMVVQGVSTAKISKITEELCGQTFSKSTVSKLCKELDVVIHNFKNRPLVNAYPFVMLDAMYIKVREDHRVCSKALFVALGINEEGYKEIIGFDVYETETEDGWTEFLQSLKKRSLKGTDLFISDNHKGLTKAIQKEFPTVSWQRCQVHFRRNILDKVPKKYQTVIGEALTEMFNAQDVETAREKRNELLSEYGPLCTSAMEILDEGFEDTMAVMALPKKYRKSLRTTNLLERENEELRRREKVIRIFPNQASAIRLMGAVLLDHHENWLGQNRIFSMKEYHERRGEILKNIPKLTQAA
jgi:transposase-like protein